MARLLHYVEFTCKCRTPDNDPCGHTEEQLAQYAEWTAPRAGMFLWLKLSQVDDAMDIFEELKAAKVVVVPGDALAHVPDVAT